MLSHIVPLVPLVYDKVDRDPLLMTLNLDMPRDDFDDNDIVVDAVDVVVVIQLEYP